MSSVIKAIQSGRIWDFDGGIHPPEMKSQSNNTPIRRIDLAPYYVVPLQQHAGQAGDLIVKTGEKVLKGQPLTQYHGGGRVLPVHAPTSGTIVAIEPRTIAHPSGLSDLCVVIEPDGNDTWVEREQIEDYHLLTPEQLIAKIRAAGIAGLGGAGFPTAAKLTGGANLIKLLIINAAECEPYITADDRLMQDRADEIIEGIRILRHILRPEQVVIGIEDNKSLAIESLRKSLDGSEDIQLRIIPTKYPSGGAKQLIKILTGMEVPKGKHSSAIGVLMQNVGTAFAIKRAIIEGEPLIERVVTLTGDAIHDKGNIWARLGTPVQHLLSHAGYRRTAGNGQIIIGGPLMGFSLPHLDVPVVKITNCILAPGAAEFGEEHAEQACIRCSSCADACPVNLLPQQLYWFSRGKEHDKARQYNIMDCIECGACAYVCPSNIPLVQYYRQEKAELWEIRREERKSEIAKQRFEAKQQRLQREKEEREQRAQQAAQARRASQTSSEGVDPVQAALARIKAKQAQSAAPESAVPSTDAQPIQQLRPLTPDTESAPVVADDSMAAAREARKQLAREQRARKAAQQNAESSTAPASGVADSSENADPRQAAVAAAIARAKARKAAQEQGADTTSAVNHSEPATEAPNAESTATPSDVAAENVDPRKAAVAAAIARAKARKAAQEQGADTTAAVNHSEPAAVAPNAKNTATPSDASTENVDPRKAAVAAAIARAKARKAAQEQGADTTAAVNHSEPATVAHNAENTVTLSDVTAEAVDPRKAAVAAAIARAKARKAAQEQGTDTTAAVNHSEPATEAPNAESTATPSDATAEAVDPRKAAVAAAIARAKARKAAQEQGADTTAAVNHSEPATVALNAENTAAPSDATAEAVDPRKAAVAAAIARAKARKAAQEQAKTQASEE
ncbi:electron transport complex subunit RsxC [Plesiomonas shigelloides]|uniref:electron transport complex subunit RsxC n=1 Tax=Plesiomonas shigelloides TaxID=703 RepID=UPI00126261BE|nr:electron transport complex subunit RsxC [Plesiomonas shigelloides]KAB7708531.1 electron transport complex subunit RsxC [Plesiomonas shigelloides]